MASAFTEKERDAIRKALREAAWESAATVGMRKTSVDELAARAGISKGAFYKFYKTKEHLFFELLEDWHNELYEAAWEKWQACEGLPAARRAAETLMEAFGVMERRSMVAFLEGELSHLLRKIPKEDLEKHYHSDETHIRDMIGRMGLTLRQPPEVVHAIILTLFLTISHRREIGPAYHEAMKLLVISACEQLIG
jgi:AcrR family transcriptional regulator